MRTSFLAFAAIAVVGLPDALAGPRAYDLAPMLRASHPFADVPCCGLWPDAGPVRPTVPPEAGLRGYDIAPLLAQPHPFAGRGTAPAGVVQPSGAGNGRTYDMGPFLAEPHPFDAGPRSASFVATEPVATTPPPMPAADSPPRQRDIPTGAYPRGSPEAHVAAAAPYDEWAGRFRPYVGGAAGMTLLRDADNTGALLTVESTYDPGFHVAGAIGGQFASGLRLEFELAYRQVALDRLRVTRAGNIAGLNIGPLPAEGDVGVLAFMFNAAWELDLGGEVRPFLLAGIGPARVSASGVKAAGVSVVDDSAVVFAWQLGVGGSYRLTDRWILDASYRWFATTDPTLTDSAGDSFDSEVMSHDVLFGLRYQF